MYEKGQIFTIDFIFASAIFLFILVTAITFGSVITNNLELKEKVNARDEACFHAVNSLMSTAGEPKNWQNLTMEDINSIGFVNSKNIISNSKLLKLIELNSTNYLEVKNILGLSRYDLYISIIDFNGTVYNEFGSIPGSETEVSSIQRIGLLGENEVFVKFKVWE